MKVLFDRRIFSSQRFGGISHYFHELFLGLRQQPEMEPVLEMVFSNNYYYRELKAGNSRNSFPKWNLCGNNQPLKFYPELPSSSSDQLTYYNFYHDSLLRKVLCKRRKFLP